LTVSLHSRLLGATALVLAGFLLVTVVAVERAFDRSTTEAARAHLQGQLYGLLAVTDVDAGGRLEIPDALREARFGVVGSGLYALVRDARGTVLWRSHSATGIRLPEPAIAGAGQTSFTEAPAHSGPGYFVLSSGLEWEYSESGLLPISVTLLEERGRYDDQVAGFRRQMWLWLSPLALALLLAQWLIIRAGLRPVQRAADELLEVRERTRERLATDYPAELRGLTTGINAYVDNEHRQLERYRNALGDLAHSLKTPLAVLRNRLADRPEVGEELDRVSEIIDYQLRRARSAGPRLLAPPVPLRESAQRLLAALARVHEDRGVTAENRLDPQLMVAVEREDLLEMLGNLLDNAFKFARSRVELSAQTQGGQVRIRIADDGPGIGGADPEALLSRGVRADERTEGQGIGLAVVREISASYGGSVRITERPGGGIAVELELPAT
jgi:two-component system sensor histidine kinase PhoQ